MDDLFEKYFSFTHGYNFKKYFYIDDKEININKSNMRGYKSLTTNKITVGKYRPLKLDEAEEKLYATNDQEFTF